MNLTVKSAVLAALALGASGVASAVDITTVDAASVAYISGSTAIDTYLQAYFINSGTDTALCQSGTIDYYSSTVTPKFVAVACTANTNTTGITGNIAYVKEDNAGSLNGIQGVQGVTFAGSPYTTGGLQFPTVSQLTASFCSTSAKTAANGLSAYTAHTCATASTTVQKIPQMGFADVEGSLFGVSTSSPVALTGTQTVILPFGAAVSLGLYHALQASQGLNVGSELIADMPSLPKSVLHGIYTGQITSWASVQGTSGTTSAVSAQRPQFGINSADSIGSTATTGGSVWNGSSTATGVTGAVTAAPLNANVYMCRRGNTSGTEKIAEWFFDNQNCASAAPIGFRTPSTTITTTLCATVATDGCSWNSSIAAVNPVVFPGNGGGDLLDCLVGNDQAGKFAIGFVSNDNGAGGPSAQQSTTTRRNWRYIRVNGVVPSIENAAAGKYDWIAQAYAYVPPSTATWAATGNAATLITAITKGAGTKPNFIGSVGAVAAVNLSKKWYSDSGKSVSLFDGGALVIPGSVNGSATAAPNAASATVATFATNPVSTVWKVKGGVVNNCLLPNVNSTTTAVGSVNYATP